MGCVRAQRGEGQTGLPTVLEAAPTAPVCCLARDTHFKRKLLCEKALALFPTITKAFFTRLNGVCAYAFLHRFSATIYKKFQDRLSLPEFEIRIIFASPLYLLSLPTTPPLMLELI